MQPKPRLPGSKLDKWRLIEQVPALADCQPQTVEYSPHALQAFLMRHPVLFLKPDNSFGGKDVIRLHLEQPEKKEADAEDQESQDAEQPDDPVAHTLVALHQSVRRRFVDIAAFDNWLQQLHNQRTFLIQQGIDLLPYQDAVVDLRTIAQRNKKGRWEVTGMFAKQAPPGLAVTNVKAGGRAMHVNEYFRGVGLDDEQQFQVKRELERLSLQIVEVFGRHYGNRLYGLDIGLDRNGKLWLIEINTRPSVLILKQIDRQMYRRSARLRWPQGRGT